MATTSPGSGRTVGRTVILAKLDDEQPWPPETWMNELKRHLYPDISDDVLGWDIVRLQNVVGGVDDGRSRWCLGADRYDVNVPAHPARMAYEQGQDQLMDLGNGVFVNDEELTLPDDPMEEDGENRGADGNDAMEVDNDGDAGEQYDERPTYQDDDEDDSEDDEPARIYTTSVLDDSIARLPEAHLREVRQRLAVSDEAEANADSMMRLENQRGSGRAQWCTMRAWPMLMTTQRLHTSMLPNAVDPPQPAHPDSFLPPADSDINTIGSFIYRIDALDNAVHTIPEDWIMALRIRGDTRELSYATRETMYRLINHTNGQSQWCTATGADSPLITIPLHPVLSSTSPAPPRQQQGLPSTQYTHRPGEYRRSPPFQPYQPQYPQAQSTYVQRFPYPPTQQQLQPYFRPYLPPNTLQPTLSAPYLRSPQQYNPPPGYMPLQNQGYNPTPAYMPPPNQGFNTPYNAVPPPAPPIPVVALIPVAAPVIAPPAPGAPPAAPVAPPAAQPRLVWTWQMRYVLRRIMEHVPTLSPDDRSRIFNRVFTQQIVAAGFPADGFPRSRVVGQAAMRIRSVNNGGPPAHWDQVNQDVGVPPGEMAERAILIAAIATAKQGLAIP